MGKMGSGQSQELDLSRLREEVVDPVHQVACVAAVKVRAPLKTEQHVLSFRQKVRQILRWAGGKVTLPIRRLPFLPFMIIMQRFLKRP